MKNRIVVILHEIYGVNPFIKEMEQRVRAQGYGTCCVDWNEQKVFSYDQTKEAYQWYMKCSGFRRTRELTELVHRLKSEYEKVYVLGFSVGATNAWLLCESKECDGIIGCYGSRIRDYLDQMPNCRTLLLFAMEDSFDVASVTAHLKEKKKVTIQSFQAAHGFMDSKNAHYHEVCANDAFSAIRDFMNES